MRGRSRAAGCGCVLACSMSRTEGLPGLRSHAEISVAAAWACVQALFRILLDVASDESPGRLCCWAFLMFSRPMPVRVPCGSDVLTERLRLALVQISAARGNLSAAFLTGSPGAMRRFGVAAFARAKHRLAIVSD